MILLIYMKIHQKLYNTMSFTLVPIYFIFQQLIRCFGCPFNPHQLRFKFSNRSPTKLLDNHSLAITQIYNTTHHPPALRCHSSHHSHQEQTSGISTIAFTCRLYRISNTICLFRIRYSPVQTDLMMLKFRAVFLTLRHLVAFSRHCTNIHNWTPLGQTWSSKTTNGILTFAVS